MKVLEFINTLTSGKQVILVDRSEEALMEPSSAKWFRKNSDNKYYREVSYYGNMEMESSKEDEFGRTVIVVATGLTKKEAEKKRAKFIKEHNGKTPEQVSRENRKRVMTKLATIAAVTAAFGGTKYF